VSSGPARELRAEANRSFERLYEQHRQDVYVAALRELGNPDDAEDVTQAAFVDAYRAILRGSEPDSPRAWLLAIGVNVRRRRFRTALLRPREEPLDEEVQSPERLTHEQADALRRALGALPREQQEVFLLREIAGLSYEEISERVEASLPAVQMLLHRARKALRTELDPPTVARRHAFVPLWLAQLLDRKEAFSLVPKILAPKAAGAAGAAVIALGAGTATAVELRQRPDPPVPAARAASAEAVGSVVGGGATPIQGPLSSLLRTAADLGRPNAFASGAATVPLPFLLESLAAARQGADLAGPSTSGPFGAGALTDAGSTSAEPQPDQPGGEAGLEPGAPGQAAAGPAGSGQAGSSAAGSGQAGSGQTGSGQAVGTIPATAVVTSKLPATSPVVSTPPISTPGTTLPKAPVALPPVSAPPVATPPVPTPPVSAPPVTIPPVATPPVSTPPVATPPVTTPAPPQLPPVAPPPVAPPPVPPPVVPPPGAGQPPPTPPPPVDPPPPEVPLPPAVPEPPLPPAPSPPSPPPLPPAPLP